MKIQRESMEFDVLIIGAGPAGLSAAIRLGQANLKKEKPLSICVLEKGAYVGAHIISGAVLEPSALDELIPDWSAKNAPVSLKVTHDRFYFLTKKHSYTLPITSSMRNKNNYIISLSNFCKWLSEEAEKLGVSIFPGFAANEILYDDQGNVIGAQTGDMGIEKSGEPGPRFQAGIQLLAKQTLLAEGCRGSLSEQLIKHFNLRENCDPQSYGIGIKELWKIDPKKHQAGHVIHSIGWPLDKQTYGGSFVYHFENNQLAIGFVIGLDYQNPYLDPFEEFQRFKLHPLIQPLLENGECMGYGSRALNEGGWQAIPKLTFPGGLLIGCSAGFLNVAKIKGIHNAMWSGIYAADALLETELLDTQKEIVLYENKIKQSKINKELYQVRNIRPAFHKGLWRGIFFAGLDQLFLKGRSKTQHFKPDYQALKPAKGYTPIDYPKPDGKITFDRLTQLALSGTGHQEQQVCHLELKNIATPIQINLKEYDAPEQRYCPAKVYEIIKKDEKPHLQINFANCLHCKTCDIKDPTQNIIWTTPEGGDGPNYSNM